MKATNIQLQKILEEILGSKNVYFQPPANIQLKYPCIVYSLSDIKDKHADNVHYKRNYLYKVTLMHDDPDNCIVDKLMNMQYADFDNSFSTQGINHYVFSIHYKYIKKENN